MNKQVSVSVRWYGAVPERHKKPLPKNQWARAGRKRKWVVRWRAPDGTRPQETFSTERDAKAFQRSKIEEFESQGPTARLKPKRVTLGEFAEEFKRLRTGPTGKRLSIGTLSDYVCALTKLRESIGDDNPLESITGADVVRFFTHLRSAGGLAPATVNKVKRSLKAVFNVAKRQLAYVKVNPCDDIREDRLAETDNRYVTPDEFAKLRKACSGQRKPLWWEAFITLCYTAGVRKDEAVHLSWGNVAFEEEEIRIVAKKGIEGVPDWQPKDFDARTIPIPSATVELLSALRIEAGFGSKMVFVSSLRLAWMRQQRGAGKWTEGQATLNNLNRAFGVIAKRAGVDDVCLHDLRRSCLTHWARKLPSHVTKELAGHSSIETTLRYYVSVREDDMSQARDAVALALLSDAKRTQTA